LKARNLEEENKILKQENVNCLESSKVHTNPWQLHLCL